MVSLSNISKNGKLVPIEEWEKYISNLREETSMQPLITDEKKAISILEKPLMQAIEKRSQKKKFGILFSGGVDSTLIAFLCKKLGADFICYTVGMEGSADIEESTIVAQKLRLVHHKKILTLNEVESVFDATAKALGNNMDVVNLGVGSVIMAAVDLAKKDGIHTFFTGLGSEEIFAGYERHTSAQDINDECWKGLVSMWKRDFVRDFSIAAYTKSDFLTPFLDKELITSAMQISGDLKIKDGHKKYILRRAAESLGLPHDFSFRPKKAAQYGSNFDKAIQKIAKMHGYRYKNEYIKSFS